MVVVVIDVGARGLRRCSSRVLRSTGFDGCHLGYYGLMRGSEGIDGWEGSL